MTELLNARLRDSVRAISALRAKVDRLEVTHNAPIAVVGMACRMPGADGIDAFWQNLMDGVDSVGPVPADRWDADAWYDPDPDAQGRIGFREAAFIDDVDSFDADLFGIAAAEAASMDPQQRLLLELAWHALEDAGQAPDRLQRRPVGVFLGLNSSDHLLSALGDPARIDPHMLSGAVASVAAGRLAFVLGLTGPALVVETACSSSLVAAHLAIESLRRGECDLAIVGGVHLLLEPHVPVALSRSRMLAPDGRCKPFDAAADGFGQGEGGGVVVLKRLADATAAGDPVRAVVRGTALNQDGRSAGLTAPSGRAQEAVIRAALANAGMVADDIDAIEAHGTGTGLGDPIEMHALAAVFRERRHPLWVGSLKGNIGHLAAGAGIAGLIKAVLMAERSEVPPSLHFNEINPHIDLAGAELKVPVQAHSMSLRAIGVSSFGFSGTNAHLIVASPPPATATAADIAPSAVRPRLLLSASTPKSLNQLIQAYANLLDADLGAFGKVCHSAARGRARLPWWVCVDSPSELRGATPQQGPHPDVETAAGRSVRLPPTPLDRQRFAPQRSGRRPALPPLPGKWLDSPSADRQLVTILDLERLPWLADHQVGGRIVVPGALLLVLMAAAAGPAVTSLHDVRFLEAIVLAPGEPIRLVTLLTRDGVVTVSSKNAEHWVVHASAVTSTQSAQPSVLPPLAPRRIERNAWRSQLAARGIGIGPAFRAITLMEHAENRATAELQRPAGLGDEGLAVHPALLDAALQVAGGTLPGRATLLPVGIDRITFNDRRAATGQLRASATSRLDGSLAAIDVILQSDGEPLVLVEGLRVRELSTATTGDWLFTIRWEPVPLAPAVTSSQVALPLILHVGKEGLTLAGLADRLRTLVALAEPPRVHLVVLGGRQDPDAGAAVGFASAIAAEHPDLRLRCIEVDREVPEAGILAEAARLDGEPWVRLDPTGLQRPRLQALPSGVSSVRPTLTGTVLIAGGSGAIGRCTAAWAAERGAAAVLIVSRRPAAALDLPTTMPVTAVAVDIGSDDALATIEDALKTLPPLGAVIHSAGVRGDGLLGSMTAVSLEAAIRPKLRGAWVLHELTCRHPVEHFILFSSIGSFIGAAGQSAYAAANASLDAFACFRQAQGMPAKVIDWGRWDGDGMAATLTAAQRARVEARGVLPMRPDLAMLALDQALAVDDVRVVISAFDRAALAAAQPLPLFERFTSSMSVEPAGDIADIVAGVLGRRVERKRALTSYGLDSLMAVDLRNRLNRTFGMNLQLADLLSGMDLDGLDAMAGAVSETQVEVLTL